MGMKEKPQWLKSRFIQSWGCRVQRSQRSINRYGRFFVTIWNTFKCLNSGGCQMVNQPHGGKLICRELKGDKKYQAIKEAQEYPSLMVDSWAISDLELIGVGAFSPLTGFMVEKDYTDVLENGRLGNGIIWSIPITLPVWEEQVSHLTIGEKIALKGENGLIYGILTLKEKYVYDKQKEVKKVYGTTDERHPG